MAMAEHEPGNEPEAPDPTPDQAAQRAAALRELVHQTNNLLAAIQTQIEVAGLVEGEEAARNALAQIARSAERAGKATAQAMDVLRRD